MPKPKANLSKYFEEIKPVIATESHPSQAQNSCAGCGHSLLMGPEGFPVCSNRQCGLILTAVLDTSPEWRFYNGQGSAGGDPTRCGMPINPLLQESSFGCKVLTNSSSSYQMRKIGRYTSWIGMPYREKAHYDEFQRISLLAEKGGLPKLIISDAMRFHKSISEQKTFRGLNRDGIIAASVYISARVNGYPRTPKEIARVFLLDPTAATRGCKNATGIFNGLERGLCENAKTTLCLSTPASFIPRYCSKLGLTEELLLVCSFVAARTKELAIVPENTPHAKAAGIIYFVTHNCNIGVSKSMIAQVSEISEVTINKCFRKLDIHRALLLPQQILDKYAV